jgi:hypothetical protein
MHRYVIFFLLFFVYTPSISRHSLKVKIAFNILYVNTRYPFYLHLSFFFMFVLPTARPIYNIHWVLFAHLTILNTWFYVYF